MTWRVSLLALTAAAAGVSAVANAVNAPPEQTRLGASIGKDLAERDRQAAQRNRALDLREQAALAAEQRLKAAAATQPPAPASKPAAGQEAVDAVDPLDELARIYQAMKPKAAAPVFEQLAMDVQVEVATRMRERATAQILAAMTPRGAATLTMAMARKGKGPGWTALPAGTTKSLDPKPGVPAPR